MVLVAGITADFAEWAVIASNKSMMNSAVSLTLVLRVGNKSSS
jgi:hypothetical protein